ncbi:DUF5995 family protein [Streptomyces sp. JH34]|uniref:DUF5995 family protein n=1 Tax=Streptomyces sp. JH34 TaxID=2793633 RepID=UPI0023F7C6D0|nr:DUF5995 family protein [Streptomyces sp. JH34]MDF6022296.1 DUF5995 family protein [Streptomyces sp. JH34]
MDRIEQFAPPAGTAGTTTDVGGVIERMRGFRSHWPPGDGVAVFNEVYLTVTETLGRHLSDGAFRDREAVSTLDVRFAERYLAAVDTAVSGGLPPECWRPLFQYRLHPGVRPLQFALAGINAHIGHDLALAVVDTCRTLGCAPVDLEEEFERVGDLLVMLEEQIREDLMPGPDLLQVADPLTHLAGAWSLERAREASWSAARMLWRLRGAPPLAEEFRSRMDAGAGLVGRFLLTPCR